jgi:hypothetical protein
MGPQKVSTKREAESHRLRCGCLAFLGALVVILCGCKRAGSSAYAPLPPEQVPQTMSQAFEQSAASVSAAARPVILAAEARDPAAILGLHELASRPDLTAEQRKAVQRSMQALLEQARAAAARGDARSDEVMKAYRASK